MNIDGIKQPIFGSWYIDEKIGSGSFGTVYKIKREEFGETYYSALKVINIPAESSEINSLRSEGMDNLSITAYYNELIQGLVQEIKILNSLKGNSNIISYEDHQIITDDNEKKYTILIRMELLTPLNSYLADKKLTVNQIVKLGTDICNALDICEKHNIIHRDIKPDNIFVTKDGNFKLGDFGVARTMEKTMSAMSQKGTYTYMAPEVYWNKPYNKTADIYSLGLVLYLLLNQNRAPFLPAAPAPIKFSDRENATKRRMQGESIPKLSIESNALNDVVLKSCAPNQEDRFQSAKEMREALENSINNKSNENIREKNTMNNEFDFDKTVSPFGNIPYNNADNAQNISFAENDDLDKTVGSFENVPPLKTGGQDESNVYSQPTPMQFNHNQYEQQDVGDDETVGAFGDFSNHAFIKPLTEIEFFDRFTSKKIKKNLKSFYIIAFITAGLSLATLVLGNFFAIFDIAVYLVFGILLMKKRKWTFALVITCYSAFATLLGLALFGTPSGIFALILGIITTGQLKKINKAYNVYKNSGVLPNSEI